MKEKKQQPTSPGISRRTFLSHVIVAAGAMFASACGAIRTTHTPVPWNTGASALPSPLPPISTKTPAPDEAADAEELPLAGFMALSAVLTGVNNLDPQLGRVYLQNLAYNVEAEISVEALIEQAGLGDDPAAVTLAQLEENGVFEQSASRKLADTIIELWYTGIYTNEAGEQVVATYVEALSWQTLRFTKPKTLCGYPGFWAQGWEAA